MTKTVITPEKKTCLEPHTSFSIPLVDICNEIDLHPSAFAYLWDDAKKISISKNIKKEVLEIMNLDRENGIISIGTKDSEEKCIQEFVEKSMQKELNKKESLKNFVKTIAEDEDFTLEYVSDILSSVFSIYAAEHPEYIVCNECNLIHQGMKIEGLEDHYSEQCPYCESANLSSINNYFFFVSE